MLQYKILYILSLFNVTHQIGFSRRIQIIKLLFMQVSQSLYYLFSRRRNYISENSLSEQLQPLLFLKYERPCSRPIQNKWQSRIFSSLYFQIANMRTKSTHKTNLTYTIVYTQEMPQISSYMFKHSLGTFIRETSQWLKLCFPNGPQHVAQSHTCTRTKVLKPIGHVLHKQFNIQQLYVLPTLYLCVLYLSENKQRLVPLTA